MLLARRWILSGDRVRRGLEVVEIQVQAGAPARSRRCEAAPPEAAGDVCGDVRGGRLLAAEPAFAIDPLIQTWRILLSFWPTTPTGPGAFRPFANESPMHSVT